MAWNQTKQHQQKKHEMDKNELPTAPHETILRVLRQN